MTTRKFLIRELNRNIKLNGSKSFRFNEYVFFRSDNDNYIIIDKDENEIGTYNISNITENFLKIKTPKTKKKQYSGIKSKPRKVKKYDIILIDFMKFVKHQKCFVDGCNRKDIEAHHIYGRQPSRHDNLCIPLCSYHHRGSEFSVHEGNVREFRKKYKQKDMERSALLIFNEWIKNTKPDKFYSDLLLYLKNTEKTHTEAIKEFIIGRRHSAKKSEMGNRKQDENS